MSRGNEVVRVHIGSEATSFGNFLWGSLDASLRYGLAQEDYKNDMWGKVRPAMKKINWNDDLLHLKKYYDSGSKEGSGNCVDDNYIRAVVLDTVSDLNIEEVPLNSNNKVDTATAPSSANISDSSQSHIIDHCLNNIRNRTKSWNNSFTNIIPSIEDSISSSYIPSSQTTEDIEDSIRHQLQACDLVERFHIDLQLSSPLWSNLNQNIVTPYLQEETPKMLKIYLGLQTKPGSNDSLNGSDSNETAPLQVQSDILTSLLLSRMDHKDNETLRIVPIDQKSTNSFAPNSLMEKTLSNVKDKKDWLCMKKEFLAVAERGVYRAAYQNKGYHNYNTKLCPPGSTLTDLTFTLLPTDIESIPFGGQLANDTINSWLDYRCNTKGVSLLWSYGNIPQTIQTCENIFFTGLSDMTVQSSAFKWKPNLSKYELSSCMMNSYMNPLPIGHADIIQKYIPSYINPLGQLEVGDSTYTNRPSNTAVEMLSSMHCHRSIIPGSIEEGGNGREYNVIRDVLSSLDLVTKTSRFKPMLEKLGIEFDEIIEAHFKLKEYNIEELT